MTSRRLTLLILVVFSAVALQAQITINQANFPLKAGDTVKFKNIDTTRTTLTAPTSGAAQSWDYSSILVKDSVAYTTFATVSGDTSFPTANLVSKGSINLINGLAVPVVYYERLDANGFVTLGRKTPATSASLKGVTTLADSVIVPSTTNVYLASFPTPKFPLTYNSAYTFSNKTANPFTVKNISVFGSSIGDISAIYTNYVKDTSTVSGYGALKVPNPTAGGAAFTIPVLLVKTHTVSVDSFASPGLSTSILNLLLSQIGLIQGQVTVTDSYDFYSLNGRTSILSMTFPNNTGSTSPATRKPTGTYAYQEATKVTPIFEPLVANVEVRMYPNPVAATGATLEFEKTLNTDWNLLIMNAMGQVMSIEKISGGKGIVVHTLPVASLNNGVYTYFLLTAEGMQAASGKFMVAK